MAEALRNQANTVTTNEIHLNMKIALLPWGNVIEDYLDSINISMESFCNEMTGGWLFGYIESLKQVEIQTVIIVVSNHVPNPTRRTHQPSGSTILILPASYLHRSVRRLKALMITRTKPFSQSRKWFRCLSLKPLNDIEPYLATPIRLLTQALQQEGCQAILCQEYEYPRFDACVLVGKRLKLPVYASFQGGNFQVSRIESIIRPQTISACDGLIVATQTEIQRIQNSYGLTPGKIAKIFNPLDLNLWKPVESPDILSQIRCQTRLELGIPMEAALVICHGRIDIYRKGLDILMEAWEQICRDYSPAEMPYLLVVGTGDDASALQRLINDQALPNIIWINEYILDRDLMIRYLLSADLYTLPSRHEGFPVAPLEAMACGLPIVATDVPGIPDILDKDESSGGIRVPCENASRLALAIKRLLDNRELRQYIGTCARQRVESHFSLLLVGQQLRDFMFEHFDP